jgi:hypothetical protein
MTSQDVVSRVPGVRPVALMDQVSVGVLVEAVGRDRVDEAVVACGVRELRRGGKLPAHVAVYLTMGLCLFPDEPQDEVAAKVTGSLSAFGVWDAGWEPPTSSAITQARKRIGPEVIRRVFEMVAAPVAEYSTPGGFLRSWRVMAIDGFSLDVPDTKENAAAFGYTTNEPGGSPFPKVRVVAVAECGTHAILDAEAGAFSTGEKTLAMPLLGRLGADWLLTADRNFYGFPAWRSAADTGAGLCWRAPGQLKLPVLDVLADGTYLTLLIDSTVKGRRREAIWEAARTGQQFDTGAARLARVVEYEVPDRGDPAKRELIALLTTITDPNQASAEELAYAYHQRWEQETSIDQVKTQLRGAGRVLRSKSPDLVYAEIYGYLLTHHAISALIARAATGAGLDPDRISYARALRLVRRSATGTAAFPP